jgi:hypothetical protein
MPTLDHSLLNPNQLRHYGTIVQDNPYCNEPMSITSPSGDFTACLQSMGTEIFIKTWAPSAADSQEYPHIVLCSSAPWNPRQVQFPGIAPNEQEEIEVQNIQAVRQEQEGGNDLTGEEDVLFCMEALRKSIISSARITFMDMEEKKEKRRIEAVTQASLPPLALPGPLEEHETLPPHTFLSKDRHSRTTPEELSERWGLSIAQAALTLKSATRRLVRSALMPLARRHRVDRMFEPNRLSGTFATDTMDMRCNSMHGERCCQVFANKEFFAAVYPTERKGDAYEPVDWFVQDYGAPETLISDGANEQVGRNSKFQAKLRKHGIRHKTAEKERSNQNPAEGTIREVRKRWCRQMFRTNCPRRLWSYGLPHVCAIMRLTASYATSRTDATRSYNRRNAGHL